jgi:transposase
MATERLPMRKIREILRLRGQQGLSVREAARALGVSVGVVSKTASRAEKAGVSWAVAEGLSDAALDERLYGRAVGRAMIDHGRTRCTCTRSCDGPA